MGVMVVVVVVVGQGVEGGSAEPNGLGLGLINCSVPGAWLTPGGVTIW